MAFSPVPAYIIGLLSIALGAHALLNPRGEYPRFGLPLESDQQQVPRGRSKSGSRPKRSEDHGTSPLIYLKASREFSYGLGFLAFAYQGNDGAITTLVAICSLAGLTDALVVWRYGRRGKVWGHALAFVGLACWSAWRFRRS